MEPLYKNRTVVDKAAMLEWYGKDFLRNNPTFTAINGGMAALYLVAALVLATFAISSRWAQLWWLAAAFAVLAVVFLLNLLLHYRLHVWTLLRRDGGRLFPQKLGTVFYADTLVPVSGDDEVDPAARLESCLAEAEGLQREFDDIMRGAGQLNDGDSEKLARLRGELESVKKRMDDLAQSAALLAKSQNYPYTAITGYQQTQNLHILYYGERAVLVDKRGFTLGSEADFALFMRDKLALALAASGDGKVRRRLEKALRQHYGMVGIINADTGGDSDAGL